MNRDSLYLIFVPTNRLDYQKKCKRMLTEWIIGILGTAITIVSSILWFPDVRFLAFLTQPFVLHPIIPFAMIVALFLATAAIVRLKVYSTFDTAVLVWISASAASNMTVFVHYVAAAGHTRDIPLAPVLLVSLVLTLLIFSRFVFVGWKLLRSADANVSSTNTDA